jgi:hypothetical protein
MRLIRLSTWMLVVSIGGMAATKDQRSACPDEIPWTGKYIDYDYGFSIVIPAGLQGFWNSARCAKQGHECTCMSDHGRIIPLSTRTDGPDRQIEAYADYGAELESGTVSEAMASNMQSIRDRSEANRVEVLRKHVTKLDKLSAERYVVRYSDKRSNIWMIEDFAEAMGNGVRYMLYLRTPESTYTQDRPLLERIISSFRLAH